MLLISLVAWRLPKDSQFPPQDVDLPEAVKFALLWVKTDLVRAMEMKMFWVLVEMDLHMVINQRLRLSSTLFEQLEAYAEFKAIFTMCISVQGRIRRRRGTSFCTW